MAQVTAKRDLRALRVYVNGLLHLEVIMKGYSGLQSWQGGTSRCVYGIELYRERGKSIVCEYEDRELWEKVLRALEEGL